MPNDVSYDYILLDSLDFHVPFIDNFLLTFIVVVSVLIIMSGILLKKPVDNLPPVLSTPVHKVHTWFIHALTRYNSIFRADNNQYPIFISFSSLPIYHLVHIPYIQSYTNFTSPHFYSNICLGTKCSKTPHSIPCSIQDWRKSNIPSKTSSEDVYNLHCLFLLFL